MRNGLRLYKQGTFIYKQGVAARVPNGLTQKGGGFGQMGCLREGRSVAPGSYRVGSRGAKTENTVATIGLRAKHIQLPNLVP